MCLLAQYIGVGEAGRLYLTLCIRWLSNSMDALLEWDAMHNVTNASDVTPELQVRDTLFRSQPTISPCVVGPLLPRSAYRDVTRQGVGRIIILEYQPTWHDMLGLGDFVLRAAQGVWHYGGHGRKLCPPLL